MVSKNLYSAGMIAITVFITLCPSFIIMLPADTMNSLEESGICL